jgi:MFS family permease
LEDQSGSSLESPEIKTGEPESGDGIFYGWYIIAAMFFATFIGVATRHGFGVFVPEWEKDFGTNVGLISVAGGIGWAVNGLLQPVFGRLTDQYGGRRVMIISLTALGFSTIAVGLVPNVYVLIAIYGFVLSSTSAGVFPTPMASMASRWFQRRRGTAISLFTAGGSFGGMLMVPFAAYLVVISDWRMAWFVMGGITLFLAVPLLWAIVRDDPSDLGLEPDGGPEEYAEDDEPSGEVLTPTTIKVAPLETHTWSDSFRSAPMWQLSLTFATCGVTTAMISVHFVRWAETEGISAGTAALAFGVLSFVNFVGLVSAGWISDHMPRKYLLATVYFVRALAFLGLIFLPGQWALWTFAVLGGASWLATLPLTSGLTADVYGLRNIGMLNGLAQMSHQIAGGTAVVVTGVVFAVWDTYNPTFAVGAVLLVAAGITSMAIREHKYSIRYQTPVPVPPAATPLSVGATSDGD